MEIRDGRVCPPGFPVVVVVASTAAFYLQLSVIKYCARPTLPLLSFFTSLAASSPNHSSTTIFVKASPFSFSLSLCAGPRVSVLPLVAPSPTNTLIGEAIN